MSVRAICLDVVDDQLVLRATPEEIARFSRGEELSVDTMHRAMDTLARQGWRPVKEDPYAMSMGLAAHVAQTGHVNARLRTRCGCERYMLVAWPPPRTVRVPMQKGGSLFAHKPLGAHDDPMAQVSMEVRTFTVAQRMIRRDDGTAVTVAVEYEEE